jgi:hypothetical protein
LDTSAVTPTASGLPSLVLRNGTRIENIVEIALEFLDQDSSYRKYDLAQVQQDDVLTETDISVANAMIARMSPHVERFPEDFVVQLSAVENKAAAGGDIARTPSPSRGRCRPQACCGAPRRPRSASPSPAPSSRCARSCTRSRIADDHRRDPEQARRTGSQRRRSECKGRDDGRGPQSDPTGAEGPQQSGEAGPAARKGQGALGVESK